MRVLISVVVVNKIILYTLTLLCIMPSRSMRSDDMITKEDFLDFCKAQGDALIDHESSSTQSAYANCAIGSYYRHLHGEVIAQNRSRGFVADLENAIGTEISDTLGNSGPSNYPSLVKLLEEQTT